MFLGFDAKRLFHNRTGLGNYSRTLVSNLMKQHPEVDCFLYAPKAKADTRFAKAHIREAQHIPDAWWRTFTIPELLKKDSIQIYHGLSNELPFKLQKAGVKSVVTIHDLIFRRLPHTYPPVDRKIYDFKFKSACEKADKIIAVSENTKQDIIHYYNIEARKINVIYQACDAVFYRTEQESEAAPTEDFLLYVGSVIERKDLLSIIQSYKFLPKDFQLPLYIIGQGKAYKKRVEQTIEDARLSEKIHWIEANTQKELRDLYQRAKMLIYPSIYEGFGIPVVEALLSKTPVITTAISSLPEAGGPATHYVEPQSPEAIAAGIEKILSDDAYRKNMIEQGFEYANTTFHPARLTHQLMDLYEDLLKTS